MHIPYIATVQGLLNRTTLSSPGRQHRSHPIQPDFVDVSTLSTPCA